MEQNNSIIWLRSHSKSAEDVKMKSNSVNSQFGSLATEQALFCNISLTHDTSHAQSKLEEPLRREVNYLLSFKNYLLILTLKTFKQFSQAIRMVKNLNTYLKIIMLFLYDFMV